MPDPSRDSIFALVDCNNFYASCERVFNPSLKDKPVVILSNNDGCAVAMSNEAKAIGISVGTPIFSVRELVKKHDVRVFSSNYALYGDMSNRVMSILADFSPDYEVYSIDEIFLQLNGYRKDLNAFGRNISRTVRQWTGIPVSVGIASTKTLAKIANRFAKKEPGYRSALDLTRHPHLDSFLARVHVEDIWGIGPKKALLLHNQKVHTALDLKKTSDSWVRKFLGGVTGLRTAWELRGISCIPLEQVRPDRQEIVSSRSFGQMTTEFNDLAEAVSSYVTRAAEKLRRQNLTAGVLQVFIHTNRFRKDLKQYFNSATVKLPQPTSDTGVLVSAAVRLLEGLFRKGYQYKKAGVVLSETVTVADIPQSLFSDDDADSQRKELMKAVDGINRKWGSNTLKMASSGTSHAWKMRQESMSPHYTTKWNEVPEIRI